MWRARGVRKGMAIRDFLTLSRALFERRLLNILKKDLISLPEGREKTSHTLMFWYVTFWKLDWPGSNQKFLSQGLSSLPCRRRKKGFVPYWRFGQCSTHCNVRLVTTARLFYLSLKAAPQSLACCLTYDRAWSLRVSRLTDCWHRGTLDRNQSPLSSTTQFIPLISFTLKSGSSAKTKGQVEILSTLTSFERLFPNRRQKKKEPFLSSIAS